MRNTAARTEPSGAVRAVPVFGGEVAADELGTTLIHEHVFVLSPELDLDLPHPEWDEARAIDRAVDLLDRLYDRGIRTVVDLTVPGQGRDVARVARVAERTRMNLVASTGFYTSTVLPLAIRMQGPGRIVEGADALVELFVRDIRVGIAGTRVRAGMLKVASEGHGFTDDVRRVFSAAATAHRETGVPITTHSDAASRNGLEQQGLLEQLGVPLNRVVIGHAGDSTDIDYLREVAARGSFIGFDRFGMAHMGDDDTRIRTLLTLIDGGLIDHLVLSHDAAVFSRMTPPSWRARVTPDWHMEHLPTGVLPRLRSHGVDDATIRRLMVDNPRRVLCGI